MYNVIIYVLCNLSGQKSLGYVYIYRIYSQKKISEEFIFWQNGGLEQKCNSNPFKNP